MLFPLSLAASLLLSPAPVGSRDDPPKGAVFQALATRRPTAGGELTVARAKDARPDPDRLWGLLDQLAVVRPHRADRRAPPSLQMFIALGTMRGGVGVHAFGSF